MTETAPAAGGDLEPYCATCGATIGHFIGHGNGWHHFRGRGIPDDPNVLYDAGHEPVVAWRDPVPAADHGREQVAAEAESRRDAQFGGHDFRYESSTDLFRCGICRGYEVSLREEGGIKRCPGPVSGPPMTLNAF